MSSEQDYPTDAELDEQIREVFVEVFEKQGADMYRQTMAMLAEVGDIDADKVKMALRFADRYQAFAAAMVQAIRENRIPIREEERS